jgi:hypothetical protein
MLLGLGIELSQLLPQPVLALSYLLAFALELLAFDDFCEV